MPKIYQTNYFLPLNKSATTIRGRGMSDAPPRDLGHALIMAADLCLQQINNPVSKSLFTQHNVELGISSDLLKNIQFTQPHKRMVVVQKPAERVLLFPGKTKQRPTIQPAFGNTWQNIISSEMIYKG